MISMLEESRKVHKRAGRASTADKIVFSAFKKGDKINYIVFYFGTEVLEKMQVGKGDKINAFMEDDSLQIIFEVDPENGKTMSIHESGRGYFSIRYCEGLPWPTDGKVEMQQVEVEPGKCTAWMPEVGVSYE